MKPPKGVLWLLVPLLGCALFVATTGTASKQPLQDNTESAGEEQFEEPNQMGSDEHNGDDTKPEIKSYERVVLEGAQIIISCPYQAQRRPRAWQTPFGARLELNNRVSGEQKQFATVSVDNKRSSADQQRVQWFKNHVPLVNLNYFQRQLEEDPGRDKEPASGLEANEEAGATFGPSASSPSAPNVNEQSDSSPWAGRGRDWHINELDELVINRVTQYFAGKYTCRVGDGRLSELVLDVLAAGEQRHGGARRLAATRPPGARDALYRAPGNGPIDSTEAKSFELEPTGVDRQANRSLEGASDGANSIKTPLGDTGPTGSSERLPISWATVDATNGPDIDDSARTEETEAGERQRERTRRPIHLAKSEIVQMNDLKSVAGFLYTKQRLYCPIGLGEVARRLGLALADLWCHSDGQKWAPNLRLRCRRLARRLLQHQGPRTGNCSGADIGRVVWFKDGKRLEFDANGRGINTGEPANVRLVADEYEEGDEPIAQREPSSSRCRFDSGRAPQVGRRSLEIEGPRRENGGQYSCSLELTKLSTVGIAPKLSFAHDNDVSCCDRAPAPEVAQVAKVELNGPQSGAGTETNSRLAPEVERANLGQRVALLESILAGKIVLGKNYIAHLVSSKPARLANIQSFSVSASERPANSSELWATLMEAGDAYARRKLADFRRLKRSLGGRRRSRTIGSRQLATSGRKASHMNNGERKFTPSAHTKVANTNVPAPQPVARRRRKVHGRPLDGSHLTGATDKDDDDGDDDDDDNDDRDNELLNNADAVGADIDRPAASETHNQAPFNYANERNLRAPEVGRRARLSGGPETTNPIAQRGYRAIHLAPVVVADFEPDDDDGGDDQDKALEEKSAVVINDLGLVIDGRMAGGSPKVIGGDSDGVAAGRDHSAGDRHVRKYKSDGKWEPLGAAKSQQDKLAPFGATRYRRSQHPPNSQLTGADADATRSSAIDTTKSLSEKSDGEQVEQTDQSAEKQLLPSDGANQAAEAAASSPPLLLPYDSASVDESLMWTAGQYLYMHMKALASSPIFGVEVAVEWSNERTNGSGFGAAGGGGGVEDPALDKDNSGWRDGRPAPNAYVRARDGSSPFATIDVLQGQNLQLQCTAQALGRLPEVKWYKRIGALPTKLKRLVAMARRIGHDLYWPLTELDLLRAAADDEPRSSFVCSQTTTIFDNLAKQTFTVVNSLQLSQYNDVSTSSHVRSHSPLGAGANINLYACIVDADVRHNYATLGVHLRQAPTKFPYEMSKRLQARSTYSIQQPIPLEQSNQPAEVTKKDFVVGSSRFDFFHENRLKFPAKSYWLPIQNGSSFNTNTDLLILTPTVLSALILFVLTSFVALLYLTVRTYRSLTLPMIDEGCDDVEGPSVMSTRIKLLATGQEPKDAADCIIASGQCLCHLKLDDDEHPLPVIDTMYQERSLYVDMDKTTESSSSVDTKQVLYDAHVHHGYSCRQFSLPTEIIPSFPHPDHNRLGYSSCADSLLDTNDKRQQQQLPNFEECYQQQQPPELGLTRVSLFENPFHQ